MPKAPQSIESVVSSVSRSIKEALENTRFVETVDPTRLNTLRFSSLPFCPVKWFLGLEKSVEKDRLVDFGYKYFTSVGTVVHEIFQTTVFESEEVQTLTDWRCESCREIYPLRSVVKKCTQCGCEKMTRMEHTVGWRGAVGHVDEVVHLGDRRIFLLDYKTTSLKNIDKADPPGYLSQISSYALAMVDAGFDVVGYALVYVPRDNPFKFRVSPYEFDSPAREAARKRMTGWKSAFDKSAKVKSLEEVLGFLDSRPCAKSLKSAHSDCPHASMCAGIPGRPENMEFSLTNCYSRVKKILPISK
jgi:hypothetical protein